MFIAFIATQFRYVRCVQYTTDSDVVLFVQCTLCTQCMLCWHVQCSRAEFPRCNYWWHVSTGVNESREMYAKCLQREKEMMEFPRVRNENVCRVSLWNELVGYFGEHRVQTRMNFAENSRIEFQRFRIGGLTQKCEEHHKNYMRRERMDRSSRFHPTKFTWAIGNMAYRYTGTQFIYNLCNCKLCVYANFFAFDLLIFRSPPDDLYAQCTDVPFSVVVAISVSLCFVPFRKMKTYTEGNICVCMWHTYARPTNTHSTKIE